MKVAAVLAISIFVSGCAFKQSEGGTQSTTGSGRRLDTRPIDNNVSYRFAKETSEKGSSKSNSGTVVASESLVRDAKDQVLRAENSLIVPMVVPDGLIFTLGLSDRVDVNSGFKGEIRNGDRVLREIPAAAFTLKQGQIAEVEFAILDLKTLLPTDSQGKVEVTVSILDVKGKSVDAVAFGLSTPPSKLEVRPFLPYTSFEKAKQISIPDAFKHIAVSNDLVLDLVGVIEIRNLESEPVTVDLPAKLSHSLTRVEKHTQVNVAECSYGVSTTANETKLNSEVRLLPLTSDLARIAVVSKDAEVVKAQIGAAGVIQVGVFTTDPNSFAIPDDKISDQTVPVRCMAQCQRGGEGDWADLGKWGWDCYNCGRAHDVGPECYGCMKGHREWCRWQDWRDWKDYGSARGGFEYYLNFAPLSEVKDRSVLLASFLKQQVPGRAKTIFSETIQVRR